MANEKWLGLIDRKRALEMLCQYCMCGCYESCPVRCVEFRNISNLPTVDAVEVVHGCNVYDHDTSFECYVCGWGDWDTLTADSCKYNYCPNCGAKMDGDGNG